MRTGRAFAIAGAAVASAVGVAAAPASAAPADHDRGLRPVTNVLQPVDPYDSQWVSIRWTTDRKVCHVRVRVHAGRDVDVDYPSDRTFTSFARGENLKPGRVDYTSFRVKVGQGPGWQFLRATVDYDTCRWNSPTMNDAIGFWLPVRA